MKRRPYAKRLPPAERKQQLLDAALAVIGHEGYASVSIEAIAREAGVTRPVVYGSFDGLDQLLVALLDRQEQRALGQLMAALPGDAQTTTDTEEMLTTTVMRLVAMIREDPETWRLILSQPEGTPPAVRKRVDRDREAFRSGIEGLLGAAPAAIDDAELASHALLGVAEYFGRVLVEDPDRFSADRLAAAAVAMLAGFTD